MEKQENAGGKMYKIGDLFEGNHRGLKTFQKVDITAGYILETAQCFSPDKALSTSDIQEEYNKIKSKHPDVFNINLGSLASYMSMLANDADSKIACGGKKKGYYLEIEDEKMPIAKEKQLYPLMEEWLSFKCEHVKDISNGRKGKRWGNPDILGISNTVFFSTNVIEVTTIEVKRSADNWRVDIFEAVSHSMFANKAYYAYLCKEKEKIDKDLLLYAHKFGIGIIRIEIPEDKWKENVELKVEYVKEVFPAPVHEVSMRVQKEFLDNFDIRDVTDFQKFSKTR